MARSYKKNIKLKPVAPGRPCPVRYLYNEVVTDPAVLSCLIGSYDPSDEDRARQEAISEIKEQLAHRLIYMSKTVLTQKQYAIFCLWREGKLQREIADQLGIQQTSVHKSLFGSLRYFKFVADPSKPRKKKKEKLNPPVSTGGILKKMKLWAESDEVCRQMQQTITDLESEFIDPEEI